MPRAVGRPRVLINWDEVDKLCMIGATQEEVAAWFDSTVATLDNALKRDKKCKNFLEYSAAKHCKGKVSLRRRQMQLALSGNATMLIWLGKQKMGQHEPNERWSVMIPAVQKEGESISEFARRLEQYDGVVEAIAEKKTSVLALGDGSRE